MRAHFLDLLYESLDKLKETVGDYHTLTNPVPVDLKRPGVYFHYDHNLFREKKDTFRIVRVEKSGAPLKLLFHRGHSNGGGKHRISKFREHIGHALIYRDNLHHHFPTWGKTEGSPDEHHLEVHTSDYIRPLPFLFLPELNHQKRAIIESRSIELLSNRNQEVPIDVPHQDWLGHHLPGEVAESHLWNIEHVNNFQHGNDERYSELIQVLNDSISSMKAA